MKHAKTDIGTRQGLSLTLASLLAGSCVENELTFGVTDDGNADTSGPFVRVTANVRALGNDEADFLVQLELIKPPGECWARRPAMGGFGAEPIAPGSSRSCFEEQSVQTTISVENATLKSEGTQCETAQESDGDGMVCIPLAGMARDEACADGCCASERVRYSRTIGIHATEGTGTIRVTAIASAVDDSCVPSYVLGQDTMLIERVAPIDPMESVSDTASTTTGTTTDTMTGTMTGTMTDTMTDTMTGTMTDTMTGTTTDTMTGTTTDTMTGTATDTTTEGEETGVTTTGN